LKSTHASGTLQNVVKLQTAISRQNFFRIISNSPTVHSGPNQTHSAQKNFFSRRSFFGGVGVTQIKHSIRNRLLIVNVQYSNHLHPGEQQCLFSTDGGLLSH
jgi:hypothetical protein